MIQCFKSLLPGKDILNFVISKLIVITIQFFLSLSIYVMLFYIVIDIFNYIEILHNLTNW